MQYNNMCYIIIMPSSIAPLKIKFKKYKQKPSVAKMEDICRPTHFKLQPQQLFLTDYFKSSSSGKGLLIYHKIGAGKTCTAISIAEAVKHKMNLVIILPASLIGNFKDELRGECGGYMTKDKRHELKNLLPTDNIYKKILEKTDERIEKYYTIYSYHKFVELSQLNKIAAQANLSL